MKLPHRKHGLRNDRGSRPDVPNWHLDRDGALLILTHRDLGGGRVTQHRAVAHRRSERHINEGRPKTCLKRLSSDIGLRQRRCDLSLRCCHLLSLLLCLVLSRPECLFRKQKLAAALVKTATCEDGE